MADEKKELQDRMQAILESTVDLSHTSMEIGAFCALKMQAAILLELREMLAALKEIKDKL